MRRPRKILAGLERRHVQSFCPILKQPCNCAAGECHYVPAQAYTSRNNDGWTGRPCPQCAGMGCAHCGNTGEHYISELDHRERDPVVHVAIDPAPLSGGFAIQRIDENGNLTFQADSFRIVDPNLTTQIRTYRRTEAGVCPLSGRSCASQACIGQEFCPNYDEVTNVRYTPPVGDDYQPTPVAYMDCPEVGATCTNPNCINSGACQDEFLG